ncbi:MAG: UDP-N-acetylmuramate--L-alanine ligase [Vicingaceae bacterium]
MPLEGIKYMHFIGIGGIGMSALARYFNHLGIKVSGYDRLATELTKNLEKEGMTIYHQEDLNLLPAAIKEKAGSEEVMIVYTPAVPSEFTERHYFESLGISVFKRAEVLGMIAKTLKTVAVAGTHGKTTTTSLLAAFMKEAGFNFVGFVGGINENTGSNLIIQGKPEYLLAEADEYDRSFLHLHPDRAVLTSLDPDHLDIYGDAENMIETYELFCRDVKEELWLSEKISELMRKTSHKSYGFSESSTARAENVESSGKTFTFDFVMGGTIIEKLPLNIAGYHNVENCTGAIALALGMGIGKDHIRSALIKYQGVKRRFEYHINNENLIYIDDYAHHPSEIDAVLMSIRKMYPGKRITGVFQPHLYSRTRDFGEDFARSLAQLNELILLDIYPAREKPIPGIDSHWLLNKVQINKKEVCQKENLLTVIESKDPEIILTIGAGDIDQLVNPIKQYFNPTNL